MTTSPVLVGPDFTKYFRKDKPDRYLNTPLFMDMWKQIKADNTYSLYSWTIKADAATAFLPAALKKRLSVYPESPTGVYLETCNKQWKYGPWGEDLFMQKTMDDAEVGKKSDFTLTDTGTCPGMRPKADKKNTSYVPSCTDSGVSKFIAVHPMRSLDAWKDCYSAISR